MRTDRNVTGNLLGNAAVVGEGGGKGYRQRGVHSICCRICRKHRESDGLVARIGLSGRTGERREPGGNFMGNSVNASIRHLEADTRQCTGFGPTFNIKAKRVVVCRINILDRDADGT